MNDIGKSISKLSITQGPAINAAGELITKCILGGGVIHTFGCGHSSLVAAEPSFRAGGLAAINFLGVLPGRGGWLASTEFESKTQDAIKFLTRGGVRKQDIIL